MQISAHAFKNSHALCTRIPTELPFCMPPLVVRGKAHKMCPKKGTSAGRRKQLTLFFLPKLSAFWSWRAATGEKTGLWAGLTRGSWRTSPSRLRGSRWRWRARCPTTRSRWSSLTLETLPTKTTSLTRPGSFGQSVRGTRQCWSLESAIQGASFHAAHTLSFCYISTIYCIYSQPFFVPTLLYI